MSMSNKHHRLTSINKHRSKCSTRRGFWCSFCYKTEAPKTYTYVTPRSSTKLNRHPNDTHTNPNTCRNAAARAANGAMYAYYSPRAPPPPAPERPKSKAYGVKVSSRDLKSHPHTHHLLAFVQRFSPLLRTTGTSSQTAIENSIVTTTRACTPNAAKWQEVLAIDRRTRRATSAIKHRTDTTSCSYLLPSTGVLREMQ